MKSRQVILKVASGRVRSAGTSGSGSADKLSGSICSDLQEPP